MGPKRFTKVPCEVEDLPEIDAVVSELRFFNVHES